MTARGDLPAVFSPHFDGAPEVNADDDARHRVLVRCLGEAGVRTNDGVRIVAVLAGSVKLQLLKRTRSVPKNRFSTSAAAPPSVA